MGVYRRITWAGNSANILFNKEVSAFEMPNTDFIKLLFFDDGEGLNVVECDIIKYYNMFKNPLGSSPCWDSRRFGTHHSTALHLPDSSRPG